MIGLKCASPRGSVPDVTGDVTGFLLSVSTLATHNPLSSIRYSVCYVGPPPASRNFGTRATVLSDPVSTGVRVDACNLRRDVVSSGSLFRRVLVFLLLRPRLPSTRPVFNAFCVLVILDSWNHPHRPHFIQLS